MFDVRLLEDAGMGAVGSLNGFEQGSRNGFRSAKRIFDIVVSSLLLPVLVTLAIIVCMLNPFYNKGSLFFIQPRMGKGCVPFKAIKFRTMTAAPEVKRGADCPLEVDRITRLGRFMRKSRIDELPQIINVLRGEMSLIGPRPDYFEHAVKYLELIPGYRERHAVRPGISGLAQTELGYVEGVDATRRKVQADLYYITHQSVALELWIFWRTLSVVARRGGI